MTNRTARSLVEGAIDLHVHVRPSVRPRRADSRQLVEEAAALGMRGMLLKDHDRSTVPDAWHANALEVDVRAGGAVCLNAPSGGLNPAAAEAAIEMGADAIFLPTDSALNDGEFWSGVLSDPASKAAVVGEHRTRRHTARISTLDAAGGLVPEVGQVIDLCAEAGVLVCTGHLGADEVTAVVEECASRGARVVVTHAPVFTRADDDLMARWAAAGALLELVVIFCCQSPQLPTEVWRSYETEAALIDRVGADAFVLSTDLGQVGNPSPAEGLVAFVDGLLGEGISEGAISSMTRVNPARALGWEDLQ